MRIAMKSIVILLFLSAQVEAQPGTNILSGSIIAFDEQTDYFPAKLDIRHAKGFNVTYHNHYKVVRVLNPWKGATETFNYVLTQKGTPQPDGFEDAQHVHVPIDRFVSLSTTYLPHLEAIGAQESLVGLGTSSFVYSDWIRDRVASGLARETGTDGQIDRETIVSLEPEVVMTYGSGNPASDAHPKLMEMGIPAAINGEFMEGTPLGRAEWMKFTALFFNREAEVEEYFDAIDTRYRKLAQIGRNASNRPTVFTNISWQGLWHASGGRSFIAVLLRDAGADYVWSDNTSERSIPLDFESVLERAQDADYWINTGVWSSRMEALSSDERYALFAAYRNGRMFNHVARVNDQGGNDYWESGVANPQIVLADLIRIFHPVLTPDHKLFYYRKLD
jgi:iron complex transport system substrate-binding protein